VTVVGENFDMEGMACVFGGQGTVAKVLSSKAMVCVAPPSAGGMLASVEISVNGQDMTASSYHFAYDALPTVTDVTPASGVVSDEMLITVRGSHFRIDSVCTVSFGGDNKVPAEAVSSTILRCGVPSALNPGNFSVEVSNNGQDFSANGVQFSAAQRVKLLSLEPTRMYATGVAASVTISGMGFKAPTLRIVFGGKEQPCDVVGREQAVCQVVQSKATAVAVAAVGADAETEGLSVMFEEPAKLLSISPSFGPASGGSIVDVRGSGFVEGCMLKCRFGHSSALEARIVTSTLVRCTSPLAVPGAKTLDVGCNGDSYSLGNLPFMVFEKFRVFAVIPSIAPRMKSTIVTVIGEDFLDTGSISCKFGSGVSADALWRSSSSIECVLPRMLAGNYSVHMFIGSTELESLASAFMIYNDAQIRTVLPSVGPVRTSTPVHVLGTGFTNVSYRCHFGQISSPARWINSSSLYCSAEESPKEGLVKFQLSRIEGGIVDGAASFFYVESMILHSLNPSAGPPSGNSLITLAGANFLGISGLGCLFNSSESTSASLLSSSQLLCRTPPLASSSMASVTVHVAIDRMVISEISRKFVYQQLPKIESISPDQIYHGSMATITVFGRHFSRSESVECRFSSVTTSAEWKSSEQVLCPAPVMAVGNHSLSLSNNGVDQSLESVALVVMDRLRIDAIHPSLGRVLSGAMVTVQGHGFPSGMEVKCSFSGLDTPATVVSTTLMVCEMPSMSKSPEQENRGLQIRVGDAKVASNFFEFDLLSVFGSFELHPSIGSIFGGTKVFVRGLEDTAGIISCKFGSSTSDAVVLSSSLLFCESPPAVRDGPVYFAVGDENQRYSRFDQQFAYHRPVEIFFSKPSVASNYGGQTLTLIGKNFVESRQLAITFGGREILGAVWISESIISVESPEQETGVVGIEVTVNGVDWYETMANVSIAIPYRVFSIFPSVSPIQAGSQLVTVLGQNFSTESHFQCSCLGTVVDAAVISGEELRCPLPYVKDSIMADVVVSSVNQPGLPEKFSFEFKAGHVIHSVYPSSGSIEGGTYVSIIGSSFFESDSGFCLFGETQSPADFKSSTLLECISPKHQPIIVPLEITCNGVDYTSDLLQFQFAHPLQVHNIVPTRGPQSGTEMVSIFGSNFYKSDGLQLLFGPSVLAPAIYVSSTCVHAVLPARAHGVVQVEMANNGVDFVNLDIKFQFYAAIQIEAFSPTSGSIEGGTTVKVETNLDQDFSGWICIFDYTTVEVSVLSNSSVSCVSPPGVVGSVRFTVVDRGRTIIDESRATFLYFEPCRVDGLAITVGMEKRSAVVPVYGSHFDQNVGIRFGSEPAAIHAFVSSTEVHVYSPAQASGVVVVECSLNQIEYSVGGPHFHSYPEARIKMLSPSRGPEMGGTTVRIHAEGAIDIHDLSCLFGTTQVPATRINAGLVECDVPRVPQGNVTLQLASRGSQLLSEPATFTIEPDIALVKAIPASAPLDGGLEVTVFGQNFREPCFCTFDHSHVAAEVLSVNSAVCMAPSHPPGIVTLTVTAGDTRYTGIPFEYVQGAAIQMLKPMLGSTEGGTHLIVVGNHLDMRSKYTCVFGKEDTDLRDVHALRDVSTSALAISSSFIACRTPAHRPGTILFRVIRDVEPQPKFDDLLYFSFVDVGVSFIFPSIGPTQGGTSVTVLGSNFRYSSDVRCKFGSAIVNATWTSLEELSCKSPFSMSNTVPLSVTVNGLEYYEAADRFKFIDWPELHVLTPTRGSPTTGVRVDIVGRGFTDESLMTCRFGRQAVPIYRFLSTTRIACIAPEGQSGNVTVEVSANSADYTNFGVQFMYAEEEVIVASLLQSGSSRRLLSISSENYAKVKGVKMCLFGTDRVDAVEVDGRFVCSRDEQIVNGSSPSMRHLKSFDLEFDEFLAEFFDDERVFHVSPLSAPSVGVSSINILGSGFAMEPGLLCRFEGVTDSSDAELQPEIYVNASIVNETFARCLIPDGLPLQNRLKIYSLRSNAGAEELFESSFVSYKNPEIVQLIPPATQRRNISPVLVVGSDFRSSSALSCKFGQAATRASFYSTTLIVCDAPSLDVGVVSVDISNNGLDFTGTPLPFECKDTKPADAVMENGRKGCKRVQGRIESGGESWVQLSEHASDRDNEYVGFTLLITDPADLIAFAKILTYTGSTRIATANFFSLPGGCANCKRFILIENESCTDLLDLRVGSDLGFVSAASHPVAGAEASGDDSAVHRITGVFSNAPRSAGWIDVEIRSPVADTPFVSNRVFLETAAEKFDPRNFRGILQTSDVWSDRRDVRIVCQLSDHRGRSHVQPVVITWKVKTSTLEAKSSCLVDPISGVARDCHLQVQPEWLVGIDADSSAAVYVEMVGGDILLGRVQLHSTAHDPEVTQRRVIRAVLAYAEQVDILNWAAIRGAASAAPVPINVLIIDDLSVLDSAEYVLDGSLECFSSDTRVAQVRPATRRENGKASGCEVFFSGVERQGSSLFKVQVHLQGHSHTESAEMGFRVWFPSTVRVEERRPSAQRSTPSADTTARRSEGSPIILRPVKGWLHACSSPHARLPPLLFQVVIDFSLNDPTSRNMAIHAPPDIAIEEIGGSIFEISNGVLYPRSEVAGGMFESTQIAARVASRSVNNIPLLIFVDTTQEEEVLDLQLYAVTNVTVALLDTDFIAVDDSPALSILVGSPEQEEEFDSARLIAYAMLSNGRRFQVNMEDGLDLRSVTRNMRVEVEESWPIVLSSAKSDTEVTGMVAGTWSSCGSVVFQSAVVIRARGFGRKSLALSFEFIDSDSRMPTSYVSDHNSLFSSLAYPPLPRSCSISPIQILNTDEVVVKTIDSRDLSVSVTAHGAGLQIDSGNHVTASIHSEPGDATVCVTVRFGKRKVEGCRTVTIVSVLALRLRGLPWPVPTDIVKEKDFINPLDEHGRMQSLQFNVTALSSVSTEHDISHLCAPQRYCALHGCRWSVLHFEVDDAMGATTVACGRLTLGNRARLDHASLLKGDAPSNTSWKSESPSNISKTVSVTARLASSEHEEAVAAEHWQTQMTSAPYQVQVSSKHVKLARLDLTLPPVLTGAAGDTYDAEYKLVVDDECVSTSCYIASYTDREGRVRVPCSYAGPESLVRIRDVVSCSWTVTRRFAVDAYCSLNGLFKFSSSHKDKVQVNPLSGVVTVLQNCSHPISICVSVANLEDCVEVKTQDESVTQTVQDSPAAVDDVKDEPVVQDTDDEQFGLADKELLLQSTVKVEDYVVAGGPLKVSIIPPSHARGRIPSRLAITLVLVDEHGCKSGLEYPVNLIEHDCGSLVGDAILTRSGVHRANLLYDGQRLIADRVLITVAPGPLDKDRIQLIGDGLVRGLVDTYLTFSIVETDSFSNVRTSGAVSDTYEVTIDQDGVEAAVIRDGAYVKVVYRPQLVGSIGVCVQQKGLHLPGSPFQVTVAARASDAVAEQSFVMCTQDCDTIGTEACRKECAKTGIIATAGITKSVAILARDAFGIPTAPSAEMSISPQDDGLATSYEHDSASGIISLFATVSGNYLVHISLRSSHISGSPLVVHVLAGEAKATTSFAVKPYSEHHEVGSPGQLVLRIMDSYGNLKLYCDVSLDVSGILSGPSTLSAFNKVQAGNQVLNWMSTISGSYALTVLVAGSEIPQSPLPVSIVAGTVSPGQSSIVGDQIAQGPAGSHALLGILLRDEYANQVPPALRKSVGIWLESVRNDTGSELCQCSGHGSCTPGGSCICHRGFAGPKCSICKRGFYGDKCQDFAWPCEVCSSNGWCPPGSAMCQCMPNWAGQICNRCSDNFYGISCDIFCDDMITCKGHGTCNAQGSCTGFHAPAQLVECSAAYKSDLCVAFLLTQAGQYHVHVRVQGDGPSTALPSSTSTSPYIWTVTPGPRSAQASKLSGTSDLIAGLEARLVLQARDVYGNSLPSGGGLIMGLLSGPSPCNLVALDMDRGQYHFRFTPQLAGQYQLVVTSSGPSATAGGGAVDTHVHSLSVGAQSVWPAACRVPDPVSKVSAASAVTFSIQARDRHGSIITSGGGGVAVVMHSSTESRAGARVPGTIRCMHYGAASPTHSCVYRQGGGRCA